MIDRMDIDALLIGALYGELTPAQEARLAAHLESHPADRTTLADLTSTRAQIRDSRIFSVQFEPPQAVSALLLQEAARRAPKPAGEAASWFYRFTRSFLVHPAMAAAAMLVVVVGVAGTLYLRHGDQMFAESAAPASVPATAQVAAPATSTSAALPPAPSEVAKMGGSEPEPSTVPSIEGKAEGKAPSVAVAAGSAASPDGYRVGLEEAAAERTRAAARADQQPPVVQAKNDSGLVADRERNEEPSEGRKLAFRDEAQGFAKPAAKPAAKPMAPAPRPATKGASGGLEVRSSPEMMPKDLEDDRSAAIAKLDKKEADLRGFGNAEAAGAPVAVKLQAAPGAATAGGGNATVVAGMAPPQGRAAGPSPAADPSASPATVVATGSSSEGKAKAPAKTASRSNLPKPQAPSAQPPAPSQAVVAAASKPSPDSLRQADKSARSLADAKPADARGSEQASEDKAQDKALIDWAQKQRDQVLALVKANNCRAAASAAEAIYSRAPDYYAANIATDRSVKPCIPYINDMRERVDRSRAAAKRANAADAPAQAAPAAPPARK